VDRDDVRGERGDEADNAETTDLLHDEVPRRQDVRVIVRQLGQDVNLCLDAAVLRCIWMVSEQADREEGV
jgi:hypothetical protein